MKNQMLCIMFIALASCSSNERRTGIDGDSTGMQSDTLITMDGNGPKLDTVDVSFLEQAAYGGLVEVEGSRKILVVTENPQVRAFAQVMVKDHGAANVRLKSLALAKGYTLPAALPQTKISLVNKMDDFKDEGRNEYYLQLMINEHVRAIDLFSLASRSTDHEIRQFATSLLPTLKNHYRQVLKTDSLFRQPRANQGDDPLKLSDRKNQ